MESIDVSQVLNVVTDGIVALNISWVFLGLTFVREASGKLTFKDLLRHTLK